MLRVACGYGVTMLTMEAKGNDGGGELKDLEAVDKVRETGDIGMIIGEILCLFAYIDCPLLLLLLELWSQP